MVKYVLILFSKTSLKMRLQPSTSLSPPNVPDGGEIACVFIGVRFGFWQSKWNLSISVCWKASSLSPAYFLFLFLLILDSLHLFLLAIISHTTPCYYTRIGEGTNSRSMQFTMSVLLKTEAANNHFNPPQGKIFFLASCESARFPLIFVGHPVYFTFL